MVREPMVRMLEKGPGRLEDKAVRGFVRLAGVLGFLFVLMLALAVGFQIGTFYFGG